MYLPGLEAGYEAELHLDDCGLCLAAGAAAQAEQWSKTFTLTGKPDLRVETSDANISVDTWDQNTIAATSDG